MSRRTLKMVPLILLAANLQLGIIIKTLVQGSIARMRVMLKIKLLNIPSQRQADLN
jgi:hypothetical protein